MDRKKYIIPFFLAFLFVLLLLFSWGCIDVARADDTSLVTNLPAVPTTSEQPNYVVYRGTWDDGTVKLVAVSYDCNYDGSVQCVWTRSESGHPDNGKSYFSAVSNGKYYSLDSSGSSWVFEKALNNQYAKLPIVEFLFSNLDIYNQDKTTIFFQQTPCQPMVGGMAAHQIVQALTAEWTGLIPLAVGLVILVIALWKGLESLYRLLKTA